MSGAGYEVFTLVQVALLACLAVGGALGALARRHLTGRLGARGLLTANTTAALLLGVTVGLAVQEMVNASAGWGGWQGLLLVAAMSSVASGFCLALGTWSTVAAEAADAVLARRWGAAARLWGAHLGLGLVAVVVGWGVGLGLHAVLAG